jgi:hypothetical protein
VPVEPGDELKGVELARAPLAAKVNKSSPMDDARGWLAEELAERVKTSEDTARDFCKTMISVCTGAIPVFFAVLKYLGRGQATPGWWAVNIIPPLLLLGATTVFTLGLRPVLTSLKNVNEFPYARETRLRQMNRFIDVAMLLFLSGVAAAIAVWSIALF